MKINETVDAQNQIKGYKKTTYGYIPLDWEIVKLEDISLGKGTYGIGAPAVEYKDNLPRYLRITDIDEQGRLINDEPKCVDNPEAKYYILQKNDIVFARTGNTTGKTYLYKESDGKLVYAGFLIKFSINSDKADPIFIKFFTETNYYWNWVKIMSLRSGQPGINEKEYAKLEIPLPNLNEQRKIASILSTWDKAIELKEKLIEQKKEQKKGLMQKLLTGEVRLPGFEEEWKEINIEKIATVNIGLVTTMTKNYVDKGVPLIRNSDILPNKIKNGLINLDEDFAVKNKHRMLKKGDIVTVHTGEVGVSAVIDDELDGSLGFATINTRITHENFNSYFVSYYFNSNKYKNFALRMSTGDGRNNFNLKDFKRTVIPHISLKEQEAIVEVLSTMDNVIELHEKQLSEYKNQKIGLMQLLLTGKVRVKV